MTHPFPLRSHLQFKEIDQLQLQWKNCREEEPLRARFGHLVSDLWAHENCKLEEWETPPLKIADATRLLRLQNHREAASALLALANERETPTSADLLQLHFQLMHGIHAGAGKYRLDDAEGSGNDSPPEASLIPALVENALGWFEAESFQEIHLLEKTALVLIKMLDLRPFAAGNGITLRLFANFYLLHAGCPPAIIAASEARPYADAVQRALHFETQPLVDLLVKAMEFSYHQGLGL